MENGQTSRELERIAADIGYIKRAVEGASPVMQRAGASKGMAWLSLITGVAIIAIAAAYQALLIRFGTIAAAPAGLKIGMLVLIGVIVVLTGIYKQKTVLDTARKIDPAMTLGGIWRELYSYRLVHIYIPLTVLTAGLGIYVWQTGAIQLIVPVIAIGLGMMFNSIAALVRIPEMLTAGYWFLFSGCIALLYRDIPASYSVSYTLGLGFMLFGFAALVMRKRRGE